MKHPVTSKYHKGFHYGCSLIWPSENWKSGIDIGAEEPIYDKVNHLKKEVGITIRLISHNMHVVMHYSDNVLALNKHVLFFGDVKSLTH